MSDPFACWAIVELLGHRRLAGYVSEVTIAGAGFLRIDVPKPENTGLFAVQYFQPSSVYAMTPTTEELARRVAVSSQPRPVTPWELPAADETAPAPMHEEYDDPGESEEGEDEDIQF